MSLRAKGTPSIAIIGGGLAGIAAAVRLRRAGIESFTVLDENAGPGGTWWVNSYPGCEVDVESSMYAFSFQRFPWTRTHPSRGELLAYIGRIIERFDLARHFRFGVRVAATRWSEADQRHILVTSTGDTLHADVVVTAVGFLSNPKIPVWPGIESFAGPLFHTSRWDHSVDLAGRRVAVIGVGSSGVQVVPAIAPVVRELLVFQREPGTVMPKRARDLTEQERLRNANPLRGRYLRWRAFIRYELSHVGAEVYRVGSKRAIAAEQRALAYVDSVLSGHDDLKKSVVPTYAFGGKRRVASDDFYATLLRDNVRLVPRAVVALDERGITDADGVHHDVDVIIAATGFHTADYLSTLTVTGRGGRELHEVWRDGAFALLGLTVPGFPNFYMMYGPGTNGGGPITTMLEKQAAFIVRNIRTMRRRRLSALDVRPALVARYNRWLRGQLAGTAWEQAGNYMKGPSGRIVTQWPGAGTTYWLLTRLLRWPSLLATKRRQP